MNAEVTKIESLYDPNCRAQYDTFHKGAKPIIVIRDQAERLWSGFHFFGYNNIMTFEKFLTNKDPIRANLGFDEPLKCCDWEPFVKEFADLQPEIYKLDELKKLKDFPRVKIQKEAKDRRYPDLPDEYRKMVYSKLKEMGLDKYGYRSRV